MDLHFVIMILYIKRVKVRVVIKNSFKWTMVCFGSVKWQLWTTVVHTDKIKKQKFWFSPAGYILEFLPWNKFITEHG